MSKKFLLFIAIIFFGTTLFAQIQDLPIPAASDTVNKIFSKVEVEAAFPGGADAWRQYLQKNLKADVPAKKKAPVGTYKVVVRFIVSKDGSISDIQPETILGYGMEEEVMRVIKKGPRWTPAWQNGKTVNAYRRQPITFLVTDK